MEYAEQIQQLRDSFDNVHIDSSDIEDEKVFDDWTPRKSAEFKSSYYQMVSELYRRMDSTNEDEAIDFAEQEKKEWIEIYFTRENPSDSLIGKIHACEDFIYGQI